VSAARSRKQLSAGEQAGTSRCESCRGNGAWRAGAADVTSAEPAQASGQSGIGRQTATQHRACWTTAEPGQASGQSGIGRHLRNVQTNISIRKLSFYTHGTPARKLASTGPACWSPPLQWMLARARPCRNAPSSSRPTDRRPRKADVETCRRMLRIGCASDFRKRSFPCTQRVETRVPVCISEQSGTVFCMLWPVSDRATAGTVSGDVKRAAQVAGSPSLLGP
jgi:hypothetical protein